MSQRLRKILAQIGSFVIAGVLLYLALQGVEAEALLEALQDANYWWLVPLVVVVLASHLLRAWRWQMLLETLPERASKKERVSIKTAFYSVMIGYMVNYVAPRLGEVVRTGNLAARERLHFSSVLGTVVAERVLDMVVLLLALGSVFVLFLDRFATLSQLFLQPAWERLGEVPALALLLAIVSVGVLVAVIAARAMRSQESRLYVLWHERVAPLLVSFREGLLTVLQCPRRGALVASTVAIWFLYLLMAYLPLVMLGMTEAYALSLLDGWAIMLLGALGVVIPSPGGTGSYHYITRQTLVHFFAVPQNPAVAYAVLTHAAQLVLYCIVGAISLVLQGTGISELREQSAATTQDEASPLVEQRP